MCKTCGCSSGKKDSKPVKSKVCSGCGKPMPQCICKPKKK